MLSKYAIICAVKPRSGHYKSNLKKRKKQMKNQNEVPVTHKGDYGKTKVRYHYEIYYIDDNGRDVLSFVSGSLLVPRMMLLLRAVLN